MKPVQQCLLLDSETSTQSNVCRRGSRRKAEEECGRLVNSCFEAGRSTRGACASPASNHGSPEKRRRRRKKDAKNASSSSSLNAPIKEKKQQ